MTFKEGRGNGRAEVADRPSSEAVSAELERILTSPDFARSRRMQGFLRYVVEVTLGGQGNRLKEYTIAVEVFGRDESFDPQTNSLVRVEAGRLRRTLTLYYLTHGRDDPLRIEIPKGRYVPEFRSLGVAIVGAGQATSDRADRPAENTVATASVGTNGGGRAGGLAVADIARMMAVDPAKPPTILVVDDEPQIEALISQKYRRRVREGSLALVYAYDGEEALDTLLTTSGIDMVLTDINMPRMDGLTLLDHLPEINPIILAVVVSAYGDMANIRTAMNRGAFDFITKPINFDDLTATIDKTLAHLAILREAAAEHDQLLSLRNEFATARRIQRAILPETFPEDERFAVHGQTEPAGEIGGDFYDVFRISGDCCGILIGEASGRGIRGALGTAVSRTALKTAALAGLSTRDCIDSLNHLLCSQPSSGITATIFLGLYDMASGTLTSVNAGRQPPYVLRAQGHLEPLSGEPGLAVGLQPGTVYAEHDLRLAPGECVFLYTDGVPGAFDVNHRQFSVERLEEVLADGQNLPPQDLTARVLTEIEAFVGDAGQKDDITCLALKRTA